MPGPHPEPPPLHRWWSSPTPPWRTSCGWVSSVIAVASSWWWQTRGAYLGECPHHFPLTPARPWPRPLSSHCPQPASAPRVLDSVCSPLPVWHEHRLIPSSDGLNLLNKYSLYLEGHMGSLCAWDLGISPVASLYRQLFCDFGEEMIDPGPQESPRVRVGAGVSGQRT